MLRLEHLQIAVTEHWPYCSIRLVVMFKIHEVLKYRGSHGTPKIHKGVQLLWKTYRKATVELSANRQVIVQCGPWIGHRQMSCVAEPFCQIFSFMCFHSYCCYGWSISDRLCNLLLRFILLTGTLCLLTIRLDLWFKVTVAQQNTWVWTLGKTLAYWHDCKGADLRCLCSSHKAMVQQWANSILIILSAYFLL